MWRKLTKEEEKESFLKCVVKSGANGCWNWTKPSGKERNRYGRRGSRRNEHYAHRRSWEIYKGPIPDGLEVLHKCDNPPCVNPDHLFLGTQQDNIDDADKKGRLLRGERHGNAKLTNVQVDEIRRLIPLKTQRVIAAQFGVTRQTISDIKIGRRRKRT